MKTIRIVLPVLFSLLGLSLSALAAESGTGTSQATLPESMSVGLGSARFGAVFQAWSLSAPNFNFRIRRAEIKFSGSVTENTRWFFMADPAKNISTGAISSSNDNKILQDLGIGFALSKELELVVGQFKIQTTAEGLDSSGELLLPERAYVARAYGDRREAGAMLSYKSGISKSSFMVSNGQKTNVDDVNADKDYTVRTDLTLSDSWKIGAFVNHGDTAKARVGFNARFNSRDFLARFEGADTSGLLDSDAETLGLNYYFAKNNTKIQGAYSLLHDMTGNKGSYIPAGSSNEQLWIMNFQASL